MNIKVCKNCPDAIKKTMGVKCGYGGKEEWIHLLLKCPKELIQGNIVEEHCPSCPKHKDEEGVISCGLPPEMPCVERTEVKNGKG